MNILDLYRDDVDGKVISVSGGREYRGPCPICGGNDRFGVWPEQNGGRGSFYCGRGSGGGNGCEIGGDAIQYLRDVRQCSFHEACDLLGIEAKRGGKHLQYTPPATPKFRKEAGFVAQGLDYPEDVVDPGKWHEHGMKFVKNCHEKLLTRSIAIAYLMSRGISKEMIKKYKLGFHAGETRNNKEYQPSFRPWPSWGLKDEKKGNGRHRMIMLPAGLVIPCIVNGRLHRLTIRLVGKDPQQPKKKYHYVRGSMRDVWLSNPSARAFVLQEAELDCIAVDGAVGDLVGTIGLGSTGVKPEIRSAKSLESAMVILDGMDYDEPRINQRTGKTERPGAEAGKWWRKQYPQYVRWPVPEGKDSGEAFAAGVDLRQWIMAGLPASCLEGTAAAEPVEVEIVVDEEKRRERILHEKKFPQSEEVVELKRLLQDAAGFFRVYDHGNALGPELSPVWSHDNPEKRRRISWLLFNSETVGHLVGNLSDGLYGPAQLPG